MTRPVALNGTASTARYGASSIHRRVSAGKLDLGILERVDGRHRHAARDGQTGGAGARGHDPTRLQLAHVARDRERHERAESSRR